MKSSDVLNQMAQADQHLQPRRKVLTAILGNGDGSTVKVDGRPGYAWIRLHGSQSELVQALNRSVSNTYGLQVDVIVSTDRRGGQTTYEVIGLGSNDILTAGGTTSFQPYLPEHASSHEWNPITRGRDVVNIYPRAFGFGRVYPTTPASMRCLVSPIKYAHQTDLRTYAGGYTKDFTSDVPAAGLAMLVLVVLDGETNALAYVNGSTFSWTGYTDPIPGAALPDPTSGQLVLSCLILYYGMTSITEANFKYEYRLPWSTLGSQAVVFGTNAERLAITNKTNYIGLFWLETDTGALYLCDGTYWYSSDSTWTIEQDQALATEEGGFITTEDGQGIGVEVEP